MHVAQSLKEYGLSDNETKIYLALLKQLEVTAYALAKEVHIPRSTVYLSLDSLIEMNLVSSIKKNGTFYYFAESPKQLLSVLEKKQNLITEVLPALQSIASEGGLTPPIKVYEGMEKHMRIWDSLIDTVKRDKIKDFYGIAHGREYEIMPKFFPKFVEKRKKLDLSVKLILPSNLSPENAEHYEHPENDKREARYLPRNHKQKSTMNIYGDNIALFSFKGSNVTSVLIKSEPLAEMLREFFLFTWNSLSKTKNL